MPKGIDYSKWNNIDVSSSEGEDEGDYEHDDDGPLRESHTAPTTTGGGAAVSTLARGSQVTIGPQGVSVAPPSSGQFKQATQNPFGNKKKESTAAGAKHDTATSSGASSSGTIKSSCRRVTTEEKAQWKEKRILNGCYCPSRGYFFSQTKETVTLGLILSTHDEQSIESVVAAKDFCQASKVREVVAVFSSTPSGGTCTEQKDLAAGGGGRSQHSLRISFRNATKHLEGLASLTSSAIPLTELASEIPLRYPVHDSLLLTTPPKSSSDDSSQLDWELLTVPAPSSDSALDDAAWVWHRVLQVELKKAHVGQGVYLWWDRLLWDEPQPTVDVVHGVECRSEEKAKAFKEVWESAQQQFTGGAHQSHAPSS